MSKDRPTKAVDPAQFLAEQGCSSVDEYLDVNIRPILQVPEAGALLGMGPVTSYNAAKTGHLPVVQVSTRRFVVPTAAMRRLLALDDMPTSPVVEAV